MVIDKIRASVNKMIEGDAGCVPRSDDNAIPTFSKEQGDGELRSPPRAIYMITGTGLGFRRWEGHGRKQRLWRRWGGR